MARTRILIAEDHKEMRDKVVQQLENDFEIIGLVGDGDAVLKMAPEMLPDVCVLDISMPILNGIEAAQKLKARGSTSRIIFLTLHEDPDFLKAALDTGALGYVLKSRLACDLVPAIDAVIAGRLFISPSSHLSERCKAS
jgi:DNA-binding NarL/FixJ family response regulator